MIITKTDGISMSLKEEIQTAIDSGQKVLVDFYGSTCAPCKALAMQLAKVESEHADVKIIKVQSDGSDEEQALFAEKGIRTVPQLYFYKDAKEIAHYGGVIPYSKIMEIFGE